MINFLRFVAAVMVWTSLFLFTGLFIGSSVYCYLKYDTLKDGETESSDFGDLFNQGMKAPNFTKL